MRELTERRFLRAATRGRPLAGAIFAVTALLGTAGWARRSRPIWYWPNRS